MKNDSICPDCVNKHDCKTVYQAMGRSDQPNVVWKVVFAFVVPMLVFLGAIAGLGRLFEKILEVQSHQILVTFLSAVGITVMTAWLICRIQSGRSGPEDKCNGSM